MNKEEVFNQIEKFNQTLTNPSVANSDPYQKSYLYVPSDEAKEKAEFVGFLQSKNLFDTSYTNILDLTFGSGNLTSHIVFDNSIEYKHIIFNDKNDINTNQNIASFVDNANISQLDILDSTQFENIDANLVILNPQIGGSYTDGDILKQKQNKEKTKDIYEKIKKTIEHFYIQGSTIVFYGKEKDFEALFENEFYIRYMDESNQLYVLQKDMSDKKCFEKKDDGFEINNDCEFKKEFVQADINFEELLGELSQVDVNEGITGMFKNENKIPNKEVNKQDSKTFSLSPKGKENWYKFTYKNILFKGVPGTGKSRAVNRIITKELGLNKNDENVLRINIHSASSNSDLMQGIGISSDGGQIHYGEKQGLILDLIKRATFSPNQPFVLVLEEIQENSLNELIGDLIYLIEDDKRAKITADDKEYISYETLVNHITKDEKVDYVQIPFLVSSHTEYRKMIIPNNLYIFCTSNYRDDKKIIEDNLLRRFEVIEIYPKVSVASEYTRDFFKSLNEAIIDVMNDEIHPDRFQIGHAIFQKVVDKNGFYRVLLKVVTEFKDIKEIDFDEFKKILQKTKFPDSADGELKNSKNYFELINMLQDKIDYNFLNEDSN